MSYRRSTLASIDANAAPINGPAAGAPSPAVKGGGISSRPVGASRQSMLPTRSSAAAAASSQEEDYRRRDASMGGSQGPSQSQRSASGGRQSMAVTSTPAAGRRSVSGRASLAPNSVSNARESLLNSSQYLGSRAGGSGETRPVKTRAFQESMWALLTSALGENNMSGGQNIKKAVREPTQLAFVDMFQTIWKRYIDPEQVFESSAGTAPGGSSGAGPGAGTSAGLGTVMSKAVDEIIGLLREISYPALDDLTKSRLSAAGSTGNWPYCLAMLGWLVQIGEKVNDDSFPLGVRNRVPDPMSTDPGDDFQDSRMAYFYPYLYSTYDKFWANQDEFPEEREELERIFDERDQQVQRDVEELHKKATVLGRELHELKFNPSPLEEAKAADDLLVSDIRKFQEYYNSHIKRKIDKADTHIKRFASTEAEVQARLKTLQSERDQLQKEVEMQPMSSDEYDRLEGHHRTLQEQLNLLEHKKAGIEVERGNIELEAYRKQSAMEEDFKAFNMLGRDVALLPFKLPRDCSAVKVDGLTTAEELTFERGELYPDVDMKNFLGPLIARMKDEESAKRMHIAEEKLKLNQKYDVLLDEVKAAREMLAQLTKTYDLTRADIDKVNQVSKEEGELADSMERDHQRLIHDTEAAGHMAVSEQTAREARLRWQHEQTASSYKQHITAMNDEMVAAMNRLLTLKDDVAQALEKLKIATTVNGSSSEMMS